MNKITTETLSTSLLGAKFRRTSQSESSIEIALQLKMDQISTIEEADRFWNHLNRRAKFTKNLDLLNRFATKLSSLEPPSTSIQLRRFHIDRKNRIHEQVDERRTEIERLLNNQCSKKLDFVFQVLEVFFRLIEIGVLFC